MSLKLPFLALILKYTSNLEYLLCGLQVVLETEVPGNSNIDKILVKRDVLPLIRLVYLNISVNFSCL